MHKTSVRVARVCLLAVLCFASLAFPRYGSAQSRVIDGSKTPTLIPDSVAYRFFFGAVCEPPNASPEQRKRQAAKLGPAALSDEDIQTAYEVLSDYHVKYQDWQTRYDKAVQDQKQFGAGLDHASLMAEREQLVQDTHDQLSHRMSPIDVRKLEQFIQHEKTHMMVVE